MNAHGFNPGDRISLTTPDGAADYWIVNTPPDRRRARVRRRFAAAVVAVSAVLALLGFVGLALAAAYAATVIAAGPFGRSAR